MSKVWSRLTSPRMGGGGGSMGSVVGVVIIQRHYLNLRRFANTYLGHFDKSSFAKVTNAYS